MKIGVYGNLTLDELDRNGKHLIRPGGSALYSSLAAAYLGARVSIFSNIGRDYPKNILSSISSHLIDIAGVKKFDGLTTRFRISYNADSRRLEMVHPGRKLKPRHLLRSFQAIHLGPVFNEIGLDTLAYARRHSEFLTLDKESQPILVEVQSCEGDRGGSSRHGSGFDYSCLSEEAIAQGSSIRNNHPRSIRFSSSEKVWRRFPNSIGSGAQGG